MILFREVDQIRELITQCRKLGIPRICLNSMFHLR